MMPRRGQSNRRTKMGATTYRAGGFSPRGLANSKNVTQWERPHGLKPVARLRFPAFTLMEMLVAVGLLLVMMGLASQVFKIALDGTGRLTQLSEIDRSIRMFEDQLSRELATVDPTRSIMAIGTHPSPAYWTEEQQERDDDGNVLNGIGDQQFIIDPLRENPTLGYDPLDGDDDRSFDGDNDRQESVIPQLPRADILMFVANLSDERSKVDDSIKSDGPVMIVYNHAELGVLNARNIAVEITIAQQIGTTNATMGYNNDSTDDWVGGLRPIPALQNGGGMDLRPSVQDIARNWHLARRAILLKDTFDSKENPPAGGVGFGFDRYAHVLSPTNPAGNDFVGFIQGPTAGINGQYERHYLNWILGGEMDVVSPAGGPVSAPFLGAVGGTLQDFVYEYEVPNRYFGGQFTLDRLAADADGNGVQDENGAVMTRTLNGALSGYRGPVPAWWLGRSQLDLEPSAAVRHRLGHYFLSNCASFKVEWTPNDIRLEQAGLPEVVWIDPFKEPGDTRLGTYAGGGPANSITPAPPAGVEKPLHLDEFEIMAQKMAPESGVALFNNAVLGASGASPFAPSGSLLSQVQQSLIPRFGLSIPLGVGGVGPLQSNVFDGDPTTVGTVEPSYNTHSWYAKNLETLDRDGDGFIDQTKTSTGSDPMWPKALRITIDLFDDAGKLERPVRHTFIVPIGSKGDRKSS